MPNSPVAKRRLVSIQQYADHREQHRRTIDNYLERRYIRGYRVRGVRGVLIDLDEADAALAKLPTYLVRTGYGSHRNADIVFLAEAEVVAQ